MSQQWDRLPELFHRALGLPAGERSAFLTRECGSDSLLRSRLDAMLKKSEETIDHSRLGEQTSEALLSTLIAPTMPDTVHQYRILEVVGAGGMGTVYRAQQDAPQREVAVKVLANAFSSEMGRQRFSYEIEALGRLTHPGIAQVHDAGVFESAVGPQPFFAMEFVDGVDLVQYVESNSLTIDQQVQLLIRIAQAVHHAHQNGIVHRDLKPANVLVDRSGNPKILDFGAARVVDSHMVSSFHPTKTGQVIGTLGYMSPEQASGDRAVDARSDVYSLGVLLFQTVSGVLPHRAEDRSVPELLRSIADDDAPLLGSIVTNCPLDLQIVVSKALDRSPERRYSSASEFAADLQRFLDDEPILARPQSSIYQIVKFAKRNSQLVAGVAIGVLLLVVGFALAVGGYLEATAAKDTALARADEADRVVDLITQIFDSVSASGRGALVVDALDETYELLNHDIRETPVIHARMQRVLAQGYHAVGETTLAEELVAKAITTFEAEGCEDYLWATRQDYAVLLSSTERAIDAQELLTRVVDRYREKYGPEDARTLEAELNHAKARYSSGEFADLEKSVSALIGSGTRSLGREHEVVLLLRELLSRIYSETARYGEARTILENLVEIRLEKSGRVSLETLSAVQSLGESYVRAGNVEGAIELLRDLHRVMRENYGPDHPRTLTVRSSLAVALADGGHLKEAEETVIEVLAARERKLGESHPDTIVSLNNLGSIYYSSRRTEEAVVMYQKLLARSQATFGPDHPDTLMSALNLAENQRAAGRLAEAEAGLRDVLARGSAAFGEHHRLTLTAAHNLAGLYRRTKRLEEAEALYRTVTSAPRLDITFKSRYFLAVTLDLLERRGEAIDLLRQSIVWAVPNLGDRHPNTMAARAALLRILRRANRVDEATALCETMVAGYEPGDRSSRALNLRRELVRLYLRLEKPEKADPVSLGLLRDREALLGEAKGNAGTDDYVQLHLAQRLRGDVLLALGQAEEAIDLFRSALSGLELKSEDSYFEALARRSLGRGLTALGEYKSAEGELLAAMRLTPRDQKVGFKSCQVALVALYEAWGRPEEAEKHRNAER